MTESSELLGKRIAELRRDRGWTQKELAERAGITPTYVSEIENGRTKNVGSSTLLDLAEALGASLDYLLGRRDEREEREPLSIPPNLSDAAEREGWSYEETRMLLEVRKMLAARRTETKRRIRVPEELSQDDWIRYHSLYIEGDADG